MKHDIVCGCDSCGGSNHFDWTDVLGAVVPGYKKTLADVQGGIAAGKTAAEKITPIAEYIADHYIGMIVGLVVILVVSNMIAIYLSKKF